MVPSPLRPAGALDHPGDLDVLDRDAGQVRDRDLIGARSSEGWVTDDLAQLDEGALLDESGPDRVPALAVPAALRDAVGDDAIGLRQEG